MSTIISQVSSIYALRFEPLPSHPLKNARFIRVDRTVLVQSSTGQLYTDAVHSGMAYSNAHDGRFESLLKACIKLGVLTPAAVKEHTAACAERAKRRDDAYAAAKVLAGAKELGIKLTKAQQQRIQAAKERE